MDGDEMEKRLLDAVERLAVAVEQLVHAQVRHDREQEAERLGREWESPPNPFGVSLLLQAIPGLAAKFDRTVPPDFIAQSGEREVEIACPCGHTPRAATGRLVACECGRWFLNDGHIVHVALSPGARSGSPDDRDAPTGTGEPEPQPAPVLVSGRPPG